MALNYSDGKLYYKNDSETITHFSAKNVNTIYANGSIILSTTPDDAFEFHPNNGISIVADGAEKKLYFGVDESQIISFVKKSGDTMTGDLNISTANIDAKIIIVEIHLLILNSIHKRIEFPYSLMD